MSYATERLGDRFITTDDVSTVCPQLARYRREPAKEDIDWCVSNRMILVAGPTSDVSVQRVCSLMKVTCRGSFSREFLSASSSFPKCGWIAVNQNVVLSGTMHLTYEKQLEWVKPPFVVLRAPEAVWALMMFSKIRKKNLGSYYGRSGTIVNGVPIYVGSVKSGSFIVANHLKSNDTNAYLGIIVGRIFD